MSGGGSLSRRSVAEVEEQDPGDGQLAAPRQGDRVSHIGNLRDRECWTWPLSRQVRHCGISVTTTAFSRAPEHPPRLVRHRGIHVTATGVRFPQSGRRVRIRVPGTTAASALMSSGSVVKTMAVSASAQRAAT